MQGANVNSGLIIPINMAPRRLPGRQGFVKVRGDPADLASAVNQMDCYPGEYRSNASFPPARGARRRSRRAPRAGGKEANLWINAVVANNLVHRRREVGGVSFDFDGSLRLSPVDFLMPR